MLMKCGHPLLGRPASEVDGHGKTHEDRRTRHPLHGASRRGGFSTRIVKSGPGTGKASHAEHVAHLAEEAVGGPRQLLELETTRLLHGGAVAEVDQRARHRAIAEEPVHPELVLDSAGILHPIHEYRVAEAVPER